MDIVSWLLSKKYTDASILGIGGALAGKNCTIYSSTKSGDTTTIVFKWTADDGTERTTEIQVEDGETPAITSTEIEGGHTITFATTDPSQSVSFNVMDGEEGQRGVSVIRADVDANNYLKLELSDGNIINAGQIKTVSMVDNTLSLESANPVENRVITSALNNKVNKVSGKQLSTEDFTTAEKNKLANIENGAQVNTLENLIINGEEATIVDKKIALNIITSAVSNLQNYYLKTETYTKTEVEELIGSTVGVTIEIVQELPTVGQTNVIYFLPTETANVYSQYIYTSADGWVLIGSTSVDLSNYYTKGQVDTLLNGKQNVLTIDAFPTAMSNNPVASGGVYSAIAQMQPQFQFTNMPVASQSNYGFVYQYVGNAGTYEPNMFYRCVYNTYAGEYRWEEVIFHATVTVDSELSPTSTNPVQNKVVKEALDAKQDIMQFSTMPSAQDNLGKIVQYTGATTATYQSGCFYKAVYDSEHDTYIWTIVRFSADISVDNVLSDVSENPVQNKVITQKFDEYKTAFTGTEEEWNALTPEEQNVYDIMNITNDGDVLNLGVYLEKKTAMPVASEDVENKIYLYTGTTTQDFKKGVVYQCVSDGQTPATYSWVALIDFGTASIKNSTDRVLPNSTDLVESRAVYSAINTALSSIYTPRGNITCAELTSALLISDNIGSVYETSDSGTTTALFLQGAGHPIAVGSNIGVINAGQDRILFNLMPNAFDLTSYQKKDLTQAVEGETTVEGALGALSTNKASKVSNATAGDIATLDANGNLVDSGKSVSNFIPVIGKRFTSSHGRYVCIGTLPISSGIVSNVCLLINILAETQNSYEFPNRTAIINISTGATSTGFGISGFTNIELSSSYNKSARFVVTKNTTTNKYYVYIDSEYQYLYIRYQALSQSGFTSVAFEESSSVVGTEIYNSQTDTTGKIVYLPSLNVKADKVTSATNGDFASLDANGNLADSGVSKDVIPSDASASNKLVATNAIYKTLNRSWNEAGNRFIKLSNAYPAIGLRTNNYIVSCRNGETYLLLCGSTDGGYTVAPEVYLLYGGTGKLTTNGFYYDSTTKEIAFMTQGYNNVSVTQISGEVKDIILSEISETNPLSNPVVITPRKLVTESDFNYKSGTVNFSCGANLWVTVDVDFDSPMPDTDYVVTLESGNTAYAHVQNVTAKTTNGFVIIVWNRDDLTDGRGIINWQAYKIPH